MRRRSFPPEPPERFREARTTAGDTQKQAAARIYRSMRTWQALEAGTSPGDPALLELYLLKTATVSRDNP